MTSSPQLPSVPSKRRRWPRRLLLAGVVFAVLARAAIPTLLPGFLTRLAAEQGLVLTYDKLDLSIFTGDVELWHVDVRRLGEEDSTQLTHLEYLLLDWDITALLTGDLQVHRVEIDGLDVFASRTDLEGGWSFEGLLPASSTQAEITKTAQEQSDDEFQGFDLGLPLQLSALRFQHLQLHVKDMAREPALEMTAELNVRLSNLGDAERPARLEIFAHSSQALDAFEIAGSFQSEGPELNAQLTCQMRGLRLREFAPYLEPLGLSPQAERTSMGMEMTVAVRGVEGSNQELEVIADLKDLTLKADGSEALAMDRLTLSVERLSPGSITIETSQVEGVRAFAQRRANGHLMVAGIELVPVTASAPASAAAEQKQEQAPSSDDQEQEETSPIRLSVGALQLQQVQLLFEDKFIQPNTRLEWIVDEVALRDIQLDPTRPNHPIALSAQMHSPGVLGALTLEGELRPFGEQKTCELELNGSGLYPERLLPYLEQAGVHCALKDGRFSGLLSAQAQVDDQGVQHLNISIEGLSFADREVLFAAEAIALKGIRLDPRTGSTLLDEVSWTGSQLALQVDDQQRIHVMGWGLGSPIPPSTSETETAPLELALQFKDLGFLIQGLRFGGHPGDATRAPAKMKFWCAAPGFAQQMTLEGTLQSRPGPLDLALELRATGRGIQPSALEAILKGMGLESHLDAGEFRLTLAATAQQMSDGIHASADLQDLEFSDQGQVLLSLERVHLPVLQIGDKGIHLPILEVTAPYLKLARDREGAILALGLRVPANNSQAEASPSTTVNKQAAPQAPPSTAAEAPLAFTLDHFALKDARVDWSDGALESPLETALQLDILVEDLALGSGQKPTRCEVRVGLEGCIDELLIQTEAQLDPNDLRLDSKLKLSGLRAGPLGSYLPDGLEVPLRNGQLEVQLIASSVLLADAQGHRTEVELKHMDYRDEGDTAPLLAFDAVTLRAPRIDGPGAVFDLEELSIAGLELFSRRASPTRFELLGIAIESGAPKTESAPVSTKQQELAEVAPAAATPTAVPTATPAPMAKAVIPTVRLGKLDLGIAHLRFIDESGEQATPLDAQFKLSTAGPLTLLDPEPEDLPPIELLITGSAAPLFEEFDTRILLTPYQVEPGIRAEFAIRGMRGEGLTELLPELTKILDGSEMPNGQLSATLEANLLSRRRGPLDFNFSSGFGANVELSQAVLRATPDGPALVGLEGFNLALKSINPSSGDVHIERIELVRPLLHASNSAQGLRVAGLLLKSSNEAAEEEDAEETTQSSLSPDEPKQSPTDEPLAQSSEVRLDELLVSGADISFIDNSVEPAMHLPISEFDLELKRFTTRTLTEELPFRFNLSIYGGDVSLAKREVSSTLVGGLLSSVGSLITMEEGGQTEERPVFDEIILRGSLSLGPQPKGWALMRLRALELPAFRGSALASGIEIGDGLLDETAMLRFDGKGGMNLSSDTRISYLSLAEPADGPISAYLKLPVPLDSVLFLLRNDEGDQVIPLEVSIQDGAASLGNIAGAVGTTLATIIGEAVASSPLRVVGGVLDLVGLGEEGVVLEGNEIVQLQFPAGEVLPLDSTREALAPLLDLLREDDSLYLVLEHQLSAPDLERCNLLANPDPKDCLELAAGLRRERTELLNSRERLVTVTRAAYSIGRHGEAQEHTRSLSALDQKIGRAESALDRVYEQGRPGAERGQARRARGTALEVARRRLGRLSEFIKDQPIRSIGKRCEVRRARFGLTDGLEHSLIQIQVRQRR